MMQYQLDYKILESGSCDFNSLASTKITVQHSSTQNKIEMCG